MVEKDALLDELRELIEYGYIEEDVEIFPGSSERKWIIRFRTLPTKDWWEMSKAVDEVASKGSFLTQSMATEIEMLVRSMVAINLGNGWKEVQSPDQARSIIMFMQEQTRVHILKRFQEEIMSKQRTKYFEEMAGELKKSFLQVQEVIQQFTDHLTSILDDLTEAINLEDTSKAHEKIGEATDLLKQMREQDFTSGPETTGGSSSTETNSQGKPNQSKT